MKSKKTASKNKNLLLFVLSILLIFAIGVCFWLYTNKVKITESQYLSISKEETEDIIYPVQYSDKHITINAIVSEPRFKDLIILKKEDSLKNLANVLSSVKATKPSSESAKPEKGTWLWTPILEITPKYRDSIISGAKKNNIHNIYISIDSYLDIYVMVESKDKIEKQKTFDKILEDFVIEANKNNITVDAEGGWRNWAEIGHSYKAFVILDYAIQFNKTHSHKLRGFQYDVEPYILWYYKNDKKVVLENFLSLISETIVKMDESDLELSVVIPDFYDGANGVTPSFSFGGEKGYAFDHLLKILESRAESKIIVMSYRNFTDGKNGSIDISKNEIVKANKYKTKIIVAQETGDIEPSYFTFHNKTRDYYNKQIQTIEQTFGKEKSYGGVATHYINSFLELD